jgi:hypothetical protein
MNILTTLLIGAGVHALVGAGVFFAKEPYNVQIFLATILKGLLVALLTGFSLQARVSRGVWTGVGYGLLYGLAFGLVVFLAKGADFKTTPHLLTGSVIQGVITGALIALFAFKSMSMWTNYSLHRSIRTASFSTPFIDPTTYYRRAV